MADDASAIPAGGPPDPAGRQSSVPPEQKPSARQPAPTPPPPSVSHPPASVGTQPHAQQPHAQQSRAQQPQPTQPGMPVHAGHFAHFPAPPVYRAVAAPLHPGSIAIPAHHPRADVRMHPPPHALVLQHHVAAAHPQMYPVTAYAQPPHSAMPGAFAFGHAVPHSPVPAPSQFQRPVPSPPLASPSPRDTNGSVARGRAADDISVRRPETGEKTGDRDGGDSRRMTDDDERPRRHPPDSVVPISYPDSAPVARAASGVAASHLPVHALRPPEPALHPAQMALPSLVPLAGYGAPGPTGVAAGQRSSRVSFINGRFVYAEEAYVSVLDYGFAYGCSIVEEVLVCSGIPVLLDAHLQLLADAATSLELPLPIPLPDLKSICQNVVTTNRDGPRAALFIQLSFGSHGGRSRILPSAGTTVPTLVIHTQPLPPILPDHLTEGISLHPVPDNRPGTSEGDEPSVPYVSSSQFASLLALKKARENQCAEALLFDPETSDVTGTTDGNIFCVKFGAVFTPPPVGKVANGVMRRHILDLCREHGIDVREVGITRAFLCTAAEVFCTSNLDHVLPVCAVDGRRIAGDVPGAVTSRVMALVAEALNAAPTGPAPAQGEAGPSCNVRSAVDGDPNAGTRGSTPRMSDEDVGGDTTQRGAHRSNAADGSGGSAPGSA